MNKKYENILKKGKINRLELKNRIVMAPMGTNLENPDGSMNDKIIEYYAARAKGGTGLIIPGVVSVDYPHGKAVAHQLRLDDVKYVPGMARLVEAVHRYDSKIVLQLHHAGSSTSRMITEGLQPVSASANPMRSGELCRELTTEEVKAMVQKFVTSAVFAHMAGADGIEIHAGHGYLISQFLSSATNRRTDEYGGNPENRMRMLIEIVKGIRAACPPNFICGVRLAMEDTREGGSSLEERQKTCIALEQAGADYISATIGLFAPTDNRTVETQRYPDGARVYMAEAAKAVVNIPVFAVGKLREPAMIEQVLADGKADFICLGRPLLCDPEWVNKVDADNVDGIRNCVSCLDGCLSKVMANQELQCAVNPVLGQEYRLKEDEKAAVSKKVVVVGGGVAGMEAARSAALSGHKVILLEKDAKLGGQINHAKVPPHKDVLGKITKWYEHELDVLGVDVHTNTIGSADVIADMEPDKVLLATGAVPVTGKIPADVEVVNSWDLLSGKAKLPKGKNVSIIGGGIVGCEVAQYLAENDNKVTIFEMLPAVANGLAMINMVDLQISFAVKKIDTKVSVKVECITQDGIKYSDANGENHVLKSDVYVSALGQSSNRGTLEEELQAKGISTRFIGDAYQVGKVMSAVRAGFYAGKDL